MKHEMTQGERMQAEEVMTEKQRWLSEARKQKMAELERLGVTGYLDFSRGGSTAEAVQSLKGELNGYAVDLTFQWVGLNGESMIYGGTLDGVVLDAQDAMKLWKKYSSSAINVESLERAREEISEFDKEARLKQALKELL